MTALAAASPDPLPLADVLAAAKSAGAAEATAHKILTSARKAGWVRFVKAPGAAWTDRDYLVAFELASCASCGAPRSPQEPRSGTRSRAKASGAPSGPPGGLEAPPSDETEAEKIDRWMREEGLDPNE